MLLLAGAMTTFTNYQWSYRQPLLFGFHIDVLSANRIYRGVPLRCRNPLLRQTARKYRAQVRTGQMWVRLNERFRDADVPRLCLWASPRHTCVSPPYTETGSDVTCVNVGTDLLICEDKGSFLVGGGGPKVFRGHLQKLP